jgi:hypothetical protein
MNMDMKNNIQAEEGEIDQIDQIDKRQEGTPKKDEKVQARLQGR